MNKVESTLISVGMVCSTFLQAIDQPHAWWPITVGVVLAVLA